MKCILCKGTGKIIEPRNWPDQLAVVDLKRKAAKALRKENFSIRQIRDLLGYKGVGSVQNLLLEDEDFVVRE